ncbi:hypothetical protein FA10DRAFT_19505 [Acaromyces ingoldii]|uniref:Uncharacterized protein n=1 Tax=Acaromyces ingoldii TaxID=215250 RepID=A0A316YZ76_9BASI|nr:hypothetical protein FA10DRAFT_19505 [Acaromyces ingoldii]PWN93353.1 hypothetical protein FA10DRAFT_19505 [Acaromyces ingoldii]
MRFLILTLAMSLFLTELSVQCQAKSLHTLHRHQAILAKRSAAFINTNANVDVAMEKAMLMTPRPPKAYFKRALLLSTTVV